MSKQYETVFIMTPVLSDDQMRETVGKFETFLKENGGTMVHQENWGLRKLAYPINKKTTGFYHLFEYTADNGDLVQKLEVEFIRDERVLRFLTVSLDKYAVTYAEKRRKEGFGKKNKKKKEETVNEQ
jgi:small subunit ribosomal protein S6